MNFMKRAILGAAVAAFASTGALAANVDGPNVFWKFSTSGKPRAFTAGIEKISERIKEETGGKWNIQIFYGGQLAKSREKTSHEPPSFDAVLSWWHSNDGRLMGVDSFAQYIELFEPPDASELRPRPKTIGSESLGAKELGHSDPQQLRHIFETADPEVGRAVALAHLEASGGQPRLSLHTILINLSSGNVVKLSYARLLLPVDDGNGQTYVMNYSKPIRRSEIGREQVDHFEPAHGRKPVIAGMV